MAGNINLFPVDWLRERYAYDPLTGEIRFKLGHSKMRGAVAGTLNDDGYRIIRIIYQGRRIQVTAHQLAWTLHYGEHPVHDVDHWDLNRDNNRIKNLRHATRSQNLANRPPTGVLPKGVTRSRSKSKPYQAQITVEGKYRYLGLFDCVDAAHGAYLAQAQVAFGEFHRVSGPEGVSC